MRRHETAHVPKVHQPTPDDLSDGEIAAQLDFVVHFGLAVHPEVAWWIAAKYAKPGTTPGFTRMEATGEILFDKVFNDIRAERIRLNLNREMRAGDRAMVRAHMAALTSFVDRVQRELPKTGRHAL